MIDVPEAADIEKLKYLPSQGSVFGDIQLAEFQISHPITALGTESSIEIDQVAGRKWAVLIERGENGLFVENRHHFIRGQTIF